MQSLAKRVTKLSTARPQGTGTWVLRDRIGERQLDTQPQHYTLPGKAARRSCALARVAAIESTQPRGRTADGGSHSVRQAAWHGK